MVSLGNIKELWVALVNLRAKTIKERLDEVQMYVSFEIAAIFPSPHRRVKKRGIFKTNLLVDSIELFLYCLRSSKFCALRHFSRLDAFFVILWKSQ